MMVTCMASRNEVTQLKITGQWPGAITKDALNLCLDACGKLADVMRACLKEQAEGDDDE
jgi:exosome complex component MTR3